VVKQKVEVLLVGPGVEGVNELAVLLFAGFDFESINGPIAG
jgi:hypothetical protein